jgi:hypothetical protein
LFRPMKFGSCWECLSIDFPSRCLSPRVSITFGACHALLLCFLWVFSSPCLYSDFGHNFRTQISWLRKIWIIRT